MAKPEELDLDDGKARLDKWLWAARFFKTRQLAHEAIELGRVYVNGDRVKASRTVRPGDELRIRINPYEHLVTVLALSTQRRPAKEMHLLYQESPESILARQNMADVVKAQRDSFPHGDGRPTKKARRDIARFKNSF